MLLHDEEYRKEFIFLNCRFNDGKWFFCKYIMQYYCRTEDSDGYISQWTKVDGKFYTEEELLLRKLKGQRIYIKNRD